MYTNNVKSTCKYEIPKPADFIAQRGQTNVYQNSER